MTCFSAQAYKLNQVSLVLDEGVVGYLQNCTHLPIPICNPLCNVTVLLLEFRLFCDFLCLTEYDRSEVTSLPCLDFMGLCSYRSHLVTAATIWRSQAGLWRHVSQPGALSTTRPVSQTNSDHEALESKPQYNCSHVIKPGHHNMGRS